MLKFHKFYKESDNVDYLISHYLEFQTLHYNQWLWDRDNVRVKITTLTLLKVKTTFIFLLV